MNRQYNNQGEKWTPLYVRLSRDDENEGDSNSIQHQIEILTKYCKDHATQPDIQQRNWRGHMRW